MKRLKYLLVFILPLTVYISFVSKGFLTLLPLFVFFGIVPFLELVFPPSWNHDAATEKALNQHSFYYNWLLYLQVPIIWVFIFWFIGIQTKELDTITRVGHMISMGIMCGIIGINLGHELGHRQQKFEQFLGDLLLLSSLENHFVPYHNRGHHYHVATPQDPASARKNEWLYIFWFRSHFGSYVQAWQIEAQRMQIINRSFWSYQNKMLQYSFAQLTLLLSIYWSAGFQATLSFLIAAIVGIILLETVNYIEHYGLVRQRNEAGKYEVVKRKHAWNSNHLLGRAILFELSRHSEHHVKPDLHYQDLYSSDEAPSMPAGYPAMMLLSLLPPVFFKVMNPKVEQALSNG